MISVVERPGVRGMQKVCGISFEDIYLNAFKHKEESDSSKVFRYAMPIGNYFDCEINGDCGIVTENGYLGIEDMVMPMATPMSAFLRAGASLTPSPVMDTILPRRCQALTMRILCSGDTRA